MMNSLQCFTSVVQTNSTSAEIHAAAWRGRCHSLCRRAVCQWGHALRSPVAVASRCPTPSMLLGEVLLVRFGAGVELGWLWVLHSNELLRNFSGCRKMLLRKKWMTESFFFLCSITGQELCVLCYLCPQVFQSSAELAGTGRGPQNQGWVFEEIQQQQIQGVNKNKYFQSSLVWEGRSWASLCIEEAVLTAHGGEVWAAAVLSWALAADLLALVS